MGATIYNSDLTKALREGAKIQTAIDKTPSELADKVIATMEVNPDMLRYAHIVKAGVATGGNVIVYTTPTDRDFYLTNAFMSISKIATDSNDNTSLLINPIDDSSVVAICVLPGTTLTAQTSEISQTFKHPIKLKRGTDITIARNAGNGTGCATIVGYTVNNVGA